MKKLLLTATKVSLLGALLLLSGCSSNDSSEKTNSTTSKANEKKSELTANTKHN